MSDVWVVVIADRHVDIDVLVFTDRDKALECANKATDEICHGASVRRDPPPDGMEFYAHHEGETDEVIVYRRTPDEEA